MINILALMDFCEEPGILKVLLFMQKIIDIIFIIVPIGLIIMISIDFTKTVLKGDEKSGTETNKLVIQRLIMTIFLFAVPYMVRTFISLTEDIFSKSLNYTSCIENMKNISYYEEIKEKQKKEEDSIREREREAKAAEAREAQALRELTINYFSAPSGGSFLGRKYDLTNDELKQIAALCQQEQSSPEGSAAEASLMANRYELIAGKDSTKGADLVYYIKFNGWWANSIYFMNNKKVNAKNLAAVKEVLVLGNRTLPYYIDEHDCFSDIKKIVTDGKTYTGSDSIKKRSNYVANKTVVYNKMSSVYTFYSFPAEYSDPFGYTKRALEKYEEYNTKNNN